MYILTYALLKKKTIMYVINANMYSVCFFTKSQDFVHKISLKPALTTISIVVDKYTLDPVNFLNLIESSCSGLIL